MIYELDRLMVVCLGVLVILCLIASGMTIASSVVHRSIQLAKEVATRRASVARRSHIFEMFMLENLADIMIGTTIGSVVLLITGTSFDLSSSVGLLCSTALVACAGLVGKWIASRHAAKTPFSKNGLFRLRASGETRALPWSIL